MNLNLQVKDIGNVILTDTDYLGAGGEASVYTKNNLAYKIYHSHEKMIPLTKIEELNQITPKNVLKPQNVVYDANLNIPIGFTMTYKRNTIPLCKIFTKAFKNKKNISNDDITNLVKEIQQTISKIHKNGCLIVDLNEMNILASSSIKTPYFIDVDSWQTKSHRATALMESIRDRLVKKNSWTELSDWFSFAVIAFQLYIGIHPFKGKHPDFKQNEWTKRMDMGVSIFDPDVRLPKVCNDFSVIPSKHLEWFKSIFVNNDRSIPPLPDVIVAIPVQPLEKIIETNENFEIGLVNEYKESIHSMFNFMGINYEIGLSKIYKEQEALPHNIENCKVGLCNSSDMSPVICKLQDENLIFEDIEEKEIGKIDALDVMFKNGCAYSIKGGHLTESSFDKMGDKFIHKVKNVCNVLDNATKVFDGVIFQDLLGKCFITLPFEKEKCLFAPVKELNRYRILEAKGDKTVVVILAEKNGRYDRFILIYNDNFTRYSISKNENVGYGAINFTVLQNGLCLMVLDGDLHMFKGNKVRIVNNPPFDSSMKLSNHSGKVYFIDNNKLYLCSIKNK